MDVVYRMVNVESPPSRGAWIEIMVASRSTLRSASPPSRGAWIEILVVVGRVSRSAVAPLAGGVD